MVKILFLIHDLGQGGAEKVLVNLVNNLDRNLFDISVITLFGGGVNEQFLKPDVHFHSVWKKAVRGNIHLLKLLSPESLHRMIVKDHYDIEVSYLEGPSARIISGCQDPVTKLFCWIHVEQHSKETAARAFRSFRESEICYSRFHKIACVSQDVKEDFCSIYMNIVEPEVVHNVLETEKIIESSHESIDEGFFAEEEIKLVGVGKLMPIKGYDKLLRIHKELLDKGLPVHTYILGEGPEREKLETYIQENSLEKTCDLLGYQTNPYKYVSQCDLFVCCSTAEGFSTAATEALILGVPVVTTPVAGMKELIGDTNCGQIAGFDEKSIQETLYDIINSETALKNLKISADIRGKAFLMESTLHENTTFLVE